MISSSQRSNRDVLAYSVTRNGADLAPPAPDWDALIEEFKVRSNRTAEPKAASPEEPSD